MKSREEDPMKTFAALKWPDRWNDIPSEVPIAGFTESGDSCMLITCLGFVQFSRKKDGASLLRQLEAAVDLLREKL